MKKQEKNILYALGIIGAFLVFTGQIQIPGVTLAVAAPEEVPGAVVTDGVTVYTGTPTVAWFTTDAILNTPVNPGNYRVTINGVPQEYEYDDTTSASFGDAYEVCLMPNSTYYGKCETGTISKVTNKINIVTYRLASTPSIWVNNDPENSTTRNSMSARDNIDDDESMQPTVCFSGNGAARAFGPDGILAVVDWNTLKYDAVYFSEGTTYTTALAARSSADYNGTTTSMWEIAGPLLNGQTICGVLTVDGEATAEVAGTWLTTGSPKITVMDKHLYRHSSTDALVSGYVRQTTGSDTNSVTDASINYLLTS